MKDNDTSSQLGEQSAADRELLSWQFKFLQIMYARDEERRNAAGWCRWSRNFEADRDGEGIHFSESAARADSTPSPSIMKSSSFGCCCLRLHATLYSAKWPVYK
jgi:hypothetical protein